MKVFFLVCFLGFLSTVYATSSKFFSNPDLTVGFNDRWSDMSVHSRYGTKMYIKYGSLTDTEGQSMPIKLQTFSMEIDRENTMYFSSSFYQDGVYLGINTWMFNSDRTYTDMKNRTITMSKNSVKVSFYISGWNFKRYQSKLVLDFAVSDFFGSPFDYLSDRSISGDGFHYVLDTSCFVDGVEHPVEINQRGGRYHLIFPSFSEDLYYDPVISPAGPRVPFSNTLSLASMLQIFICIHLTVYFIVKCLCI